MSNLFKHYNNKNSMVLAQGWTNGPQKQKINSAKNGHRIYGHWIYNKVSNETY